MTTAAAVPLEPATDEQVAKSRRWLIAISVALGALLEIVDVSIVNVAIPQLQASLGVTLSEVGWVVTSYAIANVMSGPIALRTAASRRRSRSTVEPTLILIPVKRCSTARRAPRTSSSSPIESQPMSVL